MSISTNLSFGAILLRSLKTLPCRGLVVAVLLSLAAVAHAQSTATISGTVKDMTGAVMPVAHIVLTNEASKAQWNSTSNGQGFFNFAALMPATYSLRVTQQGFETWEVTGIVVHSGDDLTVPKIILKVGRTEISVTVSAEVAGVTLNSGEHSTLITAGDITRLSTVGRDVGELVRILPGFTLNAGSDIQNEGAGGLYGYQNMGPGNAQMGSWGANGAAPQQGLVNVTADGANVIDPGDMGGQLSNVNMDQVQEVKVETSNFGADQAKGPIVINAVGKSGTDQFHGGLYTYFRNNALNSNDWLSKYYQDARPEFRYFYPGGTLSGPLLLPHSHFNAKKSLVFAVGFEYYGQYAPSTLLTSFIPNAAMQGGDLSQATIASALNVSTAEMVTNCPADYSVTGLYSNVAGFCYSPNGSTDQTDTKVSGGQMKNIDPGVPAIFDLWPAANRTPQPVITGGTTQYATDGINYTKNVMATHNGFQLHARVDQNISDTLKFSAIYNWEMVNDESPTNNIYYNPGGVVPYPTAEFSHGRSHYLTLNLTKSIGSSFTNELMASGVYYYQPQQFGDPAKAQSTGTAWETAGYAGGHLGLKESQWPRILSYDGGIPALAFGYVPPTSEFLRKFDLNVADNITKVYKTHTFKAGIYLENSGNNNVTLGSAENGTMTFMRWDTCYVNQPPDATSAPSDKANLGNVIGNFLMGCPLGYTQDNGDPTGDLRYRTFEGYVNDSWKINSHLTVTLGIRLSHLAPWTDAHGVGLAVWDPTIIKQHVLYPDTASNTTWPGINWHQRDPVYPMAGVPTRALFYAPRGGVAYDLHGNGKTVFRGGWGMYYSHDSTSVISGAQSTAIGLQTYSNPSSITCTFGQLFTTQYVPCGKWSSTANTITAFSIGAMDSKDDHMPLTYNYNFTIDQQGPWKSTIEVAYVGNQSTHLSTLGNLQNQNVIPLGAEFQPDPLTGQVQAPNNISNKSDYRPYPNYQNINVANHIAWANYNSLQASWNRQAGAFVYGANYTWSKALGVRGNWDTGYIADPVNPSHDYGILAFDRPQALNLTYSYQEGIKYKGNRILGQVLNGWEISGITQLASGPDLAVLNSSTSFNLGGGVNYTVGTTSIGIPIGGDEWLGSGDYTLQPAVTCDPRKGLKKDQFVNGNCFALPAVGTQGQWNLPDVHGPALFKSDLSVFKNFTLNERRNLQFRISGFNFLNHPLTSFNNSNLGSLSLSAGDCATCVYTTPEDAIKNATITNADTFGSTAFRNGVRILELALKYNF